jgi:hypothetical protein
VNYESVFNDLKRSVSKVPAKAGYSLTGLTGEGVRSIDWVISQCDKEKKTFKVRKSKSMRNMKPVTKIFS